MLRRCVALLLFGMVPLVTGCPSVVGSSLAPAAAPAAAPDWANEMLVAVNAHRAAMGLGPVSLCGTLGVAAQRHSADQAAHNAMNHVGTDGSRVGDRAGRAGYLGWTALGENVAYGFSSVGGVMTGWMNSPGHRANILSAAYTNVGFGRATSTRGTEFWTQDFGTGGSC